jgi:C-terminal processing protease CtpA/Prc
MRKLPDVHDANDLSTMLNNWVESLGEVPNVPDNGYDTTRSFNKNFDLSWFRNEYFSKELTDRLLFIEKNRTQKQHFVKKGFVGQVEITNEPLFTAAQWQDPDIRLITLFRYWNVIEYFYPYKYKMDKKWDEILQYFIPRFRDAKTETEFHLLIRELTVSLCDSHAFFTTDLVKEHAGNKFIAGQFSILNDRAVITGYYDDSLARIDDLRLGDAISTVNGIPVSEIYKRNEKYVNGSNESVKKLGYSFRWILNGSTDTVRLTVERNGETINKTVRRYDYSSFKRNNLPVVKWKKIENSIGYVNMKEIYPEDLQPMMKDLRNTKAIIFDFRNYPEFMIDEVMSYLVPEPKSFAKFIQPDFAYPGRFEWTESVQTGRHNLDPYKGRVLMLVNEDTQSRSEYFAMAMQTVEGSITVGRQTSAADGDVLDFTFFDDKTSWITGRGVFYPDGRETQRIGIHIDVEVPLTLEDINNGRDAIFEKAVEIARQ